MVDRVIFSVWKYCQSCGGNGRTEGKKCEDCGGSGGTEV